jgi:hypothetical protein
MEMTQPARGTPWTNAITTGEGPFKRRIMGRSARRPRALAPIKRRTVTRSRYPPAILKKLRELVTKNKKNVMTALRSIGARANLETRKPGELPFLLNQQRLTALPNNRSMRLRSGLRLRKKRLL